MATFCVGGQPELTILVDGIDITIVIEKCLCAMFSFQHGWLHIFNYAPYDANNNISSSMYQISIATIQGQEWVVSSRCYKVVRANVFAHSQGNHLDANNNNVCGKSYDFRMQQDGRHFWPWCRSPTLKHCSFFHVHWLVWFFVRRRFVILGGNFNSVALPKFICSFLAYALLANVEALHVNPINTIYCWLSVHNVSN